MRRLSIVRFPDKQWGWYWWKWEYPLLELAVFSAHTITRFRVGCKLPLVWIEREKRQLW